VGSSQYVQTSANASGQLPHGHKGWWTWVNKSLADANKTADPDNQEKIEESKKEAERIRQFAQKTKTPVRIVFGVLGAVAVLVEAPLIGLGLVGIAVLYPDILGPVTNFIAGKDE